MKYLIPVIVLLMPLANAETIERRAPMPGDGSLEVSNLAGEVDVRGWDRDEIELRAEYNEEIEAIEFEVEDGHARIEVQSSEGRAGRRGEAKLVLQVPVGIDVQITTVSADIATRGLSGGQNLQSVSGDVDVRAESEELDLNSVSGDIEVAASAASLRLAASTVSGDLKIELRDGDIEVRSVSGEVEVIAEALTRARLGTTSGDLHVRAALAPRARVEVKTASGDAELALCETVDAEFDLASFSGDIEDVFGHPAESTHRYGPGERLRTSVGSGSARVSVKTMSGDIAIEAC